MPLERRQKLRVVFGFDGEFLQLAVGGIIPDHRVGVDLLEGEEDGLHSRELELLVQRR